MPDPTTTVIDAAHLAHQREFSLDTFGPGARTAGVLDHIRKEVREIADNPGDITEWADLVILAFDGALRAGHEPQQIIDAIKTKQAVNESREWPDWRTQDPDKAIEHVRRRGCPTVVERRDVLGAGLRPRRPDRRGPASGGPHPGPAGGSGGRQQGTG